MSVAALTWAFAQKIESSAKFVLVALADYANEQLTVYPSIQALQEKTCLERKTIFKAVTTLKESGFLEDTGERTGTTKQIRIYRLKGCQIWNSSKSGTVPHFPTNSAKNGTGKQCQKRHTEPSVQEPSIEPSIYKPRPSTREETVSFITSLGLPASDGESLWDKWQGNGFTNDGRKMNCWKSTARNWKRMGIFPSQKLTGRVSQVTLSHNPNFTAENNPYKGAGIK